MLTLKPELEILNPLFMQSFIVNAIKKKSG